MRNPADKVHLPRVENSSKRFLTHAQVANLARAAGGDAVVVRVLAYSGLRFGELAALRVGRVDMSRGRLLIAESVTEVGEKAVFGSPKNTRLGQYQCPGRSSSSWPSDQKDAARRSLFSRRREEVCSICAIGVVRCSTPPLGLRALTA